MAFPEPSGADHYDCNPFFALHKVEPADCRTAFSMLPVGTQPILFKNNPDEGDPYGLPFTVTHGSCMTFSATHGLVKTTYLLTSGISEETCNIRFQVAGPAAERLDIVPFVPNDMRNMAGWVLEQCIEEESGKEGGWVSKDLLNTVDYLTDPDSDIAGFFLDWRAYYALGSCKCFRADRLTR